MTLLGTMELNACGLGLMLTSPEAVAGLQAGVDYMPGGELREPLRSLVEQEQRVVLLGTGSPDLDYVVAVYDQQAPAAEIRTATAVVRFGLWIEGQRLCFRDGYAPMEWETNSEHASCVPLADGYYEILAHWIPTVHESMRILMVTTATDVLVPGDGWPYLEFRCE